MIDGSRPRTPDAPQPLSLHWAAAERVPSLEPGHAHVWAASLDIDRDRFTTLAANLSADECARAARIRDARGAHRWQAARGMLRELIACYVNIPAREVRFAYEPNGRPLLAEGDARLHFNLSHADGLGVFCFAREPFVGIDVEAVRELEEMPSIAKEFFSPNEQSSLAAIPPELRTHAFYCCWTRKEAYLKALGVGLSAPLDGFDVTITDELPRILRVATAPAEAAHWSLVHLLPARGFVGALATRTAGLRVMYRTWGGTRRDVGNPTPAHHSQKHGYDV
jgi:4'-phosphopantetheinyl transferase